METLEFEILTIDESLSVTGGKWVCDAETGEWYWVETKDLDEPFFTKNIDIRVNFV